MRVFSRFKCLDFEILQQWRKVSKHMILVEKYINLTELRVFSRFKCLDFEILQQWRKVPKHMILAEKDIN